MKSGSSQSIVIGVLVLLLAVSLIFNLMRMQPTADSPAGFILPPGDSQQGEVAFRELGCISCHTVVGEEAFTNLVDPQLEDAVPLGGERLKPTTYGQLVTAIMHPSAAISDAQREKYVNEAGESLMPELTEDMTVRQMIDLVAYLQPHYRVKPVDYNVYYNDMMP